MEMPGNSCILVFLQSMSHAMAAVNKIEFLSMAYMDIPNLGLVINMTN
jgi:hypothetical protein